MVSDQKYVIGLGEALLDDFGEGHPQLGGAPVIFTYHMARMGFNGMVISAIGKDDNAGKVIIDELEKRHLKYHLAHINQPSGVVRVNNANPNEPQYNIDIGAAWNAIPYDNDIKELANQTRVVYFGVLAGYCGEVSYNTVDIFLRSVPKECWKVFDVNLRYNPNREGQYTEKLFSPDIIVHYLQMCNVLKVNLGELDIVCSILGIEGGERKKCFSIMRKFKDIRILIVTMGEDGSSVFWKDTNSAISFSSLGMPTKVKNSVGAGDALAATFIGSLLRGRSYLVAHHAAVQASVQVCETGKSMPPINTYDIFISYSHRDDDFVKVFHKMFENKGWKVWRDSRNTPGDDFREEIKNAILCSSIVVFFSSENSNASLHVENEVGFAINNDKMIIPIRLDSSEFNNSFRSEVERLDYLDFGIQRLLNSIDNKLNNLN